jgi:hypothetical protein
MMGANFGSVSSAIDRPASVNRKMKQSLRNRTASFLSLQLFFVIVSSFIINPIAAIGAINDRAAAAPAGGTSPAVMIPSTVFTNATPITVPDFSQTSSTLSVSGTSGPISAISMTLNGLSMNSGTQDLDILLVGPGGQKFIPISDVGGIFSTTTNVTITLSDAGASLLPSSGALASGTFKPTDYGTAGTDSFVAPAPAGPYQEPASAGAATFTSVFGGLSGASVNGTWTIYLADDTGTAGNNVTISGGWSLDITTTAAAATTTTLASSSNPSNTNQAVTFTSTTTSTSTVNTGTVTFVDNTTAATLCSNVAVNGSGVATCAVPANTFTERRHTIQATYNANATFATSNGSVTQTVNSPTTQVGNTFTNGGGITLVDFGGQSTPYPSNIVVSGVSGTISKVTLTLTNVSFANTNDQNFLLVGPAGQTFVFMSDAGGSVATSGQTITFDDAAASQLPSSGSIATGTYRPTNFAVDSEVFPAPAPAGPYNEAAPQGSATFASIFGGAAPNGTWSLYPIDDTGSAGAAGSIGSWSITLTTSGDAATTTTLTSNPNPSTTSQTFLLTATVTSTSTVNAGTVTFRRGATIICSMVAVNASGVATCNAAALPQGDYVITADYNGSPGQFNISSGSVTQQVNSPTVKTGLNFANNGGITIPNFSTASPYPSRIIVSGLGGTITKVTATLNGVTAPTPDDVDFLLVGPGGQKFLMMGDSGGANALSGVNITLDDAAASALPDATAITSGTWRPASYTGSDTFPAPAPAGPYNPAAPDGTGTFANVFNGISPNGTWSLYAVEDAGDAQNTTLSGWSLTFTLAPAATTTSVTSSANPSVFGQPVTFTATVSTAGLGTPSGNVQFFDGANPIGAATALNASGQAQLTTSALSVGNHTITAQYAGDVPNGFNSSGGSLAGGQTVNKANTTSGLTSNQSNPVGTNTPVTFTVTVNAVAPGAGTRTGTATFNRNGSPVCSNVAINASGQATCNLTFTIAGNYNITVVYSGDSNFNASTSPTFVQQVVGPTAAAVSVSGQIRDTSGRGIASARVHITDSSGYERYALTNPFGYYRFTDVQAGATYVITASAKGYVFEPSSIVRMVGEDAVDVDFTGNR